MKALVTSDWHLDAHTLGVPRRPELLRYLDLVVQAAEAEGVDFALFGGDACDPGSMLQSRYAADIISAFRLLAAHTKLKTLVAIAGNHDVVEAAGPLTTLTPAVHAFERYPSKSANGIKVWIAEVPAVALVSGPEGERCAVLCLPYVARAQVDSVAGKFVDVLDQTFDSAAVHKAAGDALVVLGHMTVPGAKLGSETVELSRGRDLDLPVDRIKALAPDLVINGHYHKPQVVALDGLQIVIPGSPASFSTDDAAQGKGYTIVEV